jgi:hypothetical protein
LVKLKVLSAKKNFPQKPLMAQRNLPCGKCGLPLRHRSTENRMRIENAWMNRRAFNSKSRITTDEATVVQKLNIAASRDCAVFNPGCLFWFFLDKQKEQ